MQNKQKALFAGGSRVRCKMTSSGSQYKQSWLPAEAGSIPPWGASLHPSPTWTGSFTLSRELHCSHFPSVFWVRSSESSRAQAARGIATLRVPNRVNLLLYTPPELTQPQQEEPSWTRPAEYFSSLWAK